MNTHPSAFREDHPRLRMLWINVRLLHPLNGGDRIRTYHMLRKLKQHCHITYLCPRTPQDDDLAVEKALEYCDELLPFPHRLPINGTLNFYSAVLRNCLTGDRPFASQKYASPAASQILAEALSTKTYDLIIADYLMSWIHLCDLWPRPSVPTIVFQHNVESLIWKRHAEAARNPIRRWICRREWQLTQAFEDDAGRQASGQIAVSEEEESTFRNDRGMSNILGWVPTGVDCDYFSGGSAAAEPATMAFLGSMDWHANIDSVEHFVRHSYPAIKKRCPNARLILIGRNPAAAIRALAAGDPSIEVTGTVDDVRPYLAKAAVMILPLRVGGGTRIKVFEGMAAGLALVSTSVGVEGLPVAHGEHALIADDPESFADAVCTLIQNPAQRNQMANQARAWVRANFSWDRAAGKFLELCNSILPVRPAAVPEAASRAAPVPSLPVP